MESVRFDISSLTFEINDKRIVIAGRWPCAPHLTIYFEPQAPGSRRAGLWTPHITLGGGRKVWLGAISQDAMHRFGEGVARDLYRLWAAATTPVDLADLSREGWFVYEPEFGEALLTRLSHIFAVGQRRYRLNNERFKRLSADMLEHFWDDCIDPRELADGYERRRVYQALRITEKGELEHCWVSGRYTPEDGLGEWQRTRWDWLPEGRAMEIQLRHAGEEFRIALSRIACALRLREPFGSK